MAFGEVVHYVTQPTGWPEPVRDFTSLLLPFHCPNRPSNDHLATASSSRFSEPLASHEASAPESYTAKDFQLLIQSTAAGLSALSELPHCGGKRSTVALWSQLLRALANTLSPDVLILEDAPFIMPRAQNVASQPLNFIDGRATLLAAHAIFSTPRTHSNGSRTSSQNEEANNESVYSADSDSCDGSIDSLNLPLQAHLLRGRGRRLSAIVPVLLVADSRNIIPLLCSTLYQRRVWGIRQPVVGLCCSSTGTIATTIFGWLDSDHSEDGRMPAAHLALAADVRSDPLMGVFDFTDTRSTTSLAQFVLGLRTHFDDIKGATSIEAVDSLTPLRWRSDLPDFETQFWGQSDERVASWTHQVHVHTSSIVDDADIRLSRGICATNVKGLGKESQPSSVKSSSKRTSPLPRLPSQVTRSSASSRTSNPYANSQFAALPDTGLQDDVSIFNWLFERHALTIGRISVRSSERENKSEINAMVKMYDQMTSFAWSDKIKAILLNTEVDNIVSGIRSELCDMNGGPNCQSSEVDVTSLEDVEFISCRLSALLHAVKGTRRCDEVVKLYDANEAGWHREWDALLLDFFQPFPEQRDVLLERQLNLARNLAVDDSSFATRAVEIACEYALLCLEQSNCVHVTAEPSVSWRQAIAARGHAFQFYDDITCRVLDRGFSEAIAYHSSKDPITGTCDAILVIPCSGVATAMLRRISGIDEQEKLLKSFMLVQGPKLEKLDASTGDTSHYIEKTIDHSRQTTSDRHRPLQVPSSSRVSESKKADRNQLQNPFIYDPDGNLATQDIDTMPSKDEPCDEPSETDLLLPVLLVEYKKRDEPTLFTAMNKMRTYQVSAVTFLSSLGITDQPVFGLIVKGMFGAFTMAWKTNDQIYVMDRNVPKYDIRDPFQALQFVFILLRLARHGLGLRHLLEEKLAIIDVNQLQSKPWSKLHQRQEAERLATAKQIELEQAVAQGRR